MIVFDMYFYPAGDIRMKLQSALFFMFLGITGDRPRLNDYYNNRGLIKGSEPLSKWG